MNERYGRRRILLDLGAGFVAIVAVVGISVRAAFVGSDLRALFGVTALAFCVAGIARGHEPWRSIWARGLLVSCPGLLGTAALIVNDGLHRLAIPIGVSLTAILFTVAGLATRREWSRSRPRALALAAICLCALALEITQVHGLVVRASLHPVDRAVPAFRVTTFGGDTWRSVDARGKVVVLAFWASWCLPCRWEMPELASAFARVRGDSAVVVLAIDAGWGGETPDRGRRQLARMSADLPAAFDDGSAAATLRVHALPTIVFIDRAGRVRYEHYGFDRSERLDDVIVSTIRRLQRDRSSPGAAGPLTTPSPSPPRAAAAGS
jgi:thiol-disulfide isomerase/thioredoxin